MATEPEQLTTNHRYTTASLVWRMCQLAWRFRIGALRCLLIQVVLLVMTLAGLGFLGWGIDLVRFYAGFSDQDQVPVGPLGLAFDSSQYSSQDPNQDPKQNAMTHICLVAGLLVIAALLRALIERISHVWTAVLVQDIVVSLRQQVYHKLEHLSFCFFDAHESGTIINRVTSDVQAVRAFIDQVLVFAIVLVMSLTFYVIYMLSISPLLTVVCLLTTPVLVFLTIRFSSVVRPAYLQYRKLMDSAVRVLSENVQGVHVVKGFVLQPQEKQKFVKANQDVVDQQQWIFWRIGLYQPVIQLLPMINRVVLLIVGGWLYIQGEIAFGAGLIVFAGLLEQFSNQIQGLTHVANIVQWSLTGAQRVFEVLDTPVPITSKPDAVKLETCEGQVTFEQVDFGYEEDKPVLNQIDLDIKPGMCVAVLGSTGAGKSTFLSLIPRFYDPTQGRVFVDGIDVRDLDLENLRQHVGIVFQESFLFSHTVAENIAFGRPQATMAQIEKAAKIAQAHDFITTQLADGYDTVLTESGGNLSGGQRQRLAIARAVLLEPAILLMDDPTAAIDPETEAQILQAMDEAMAGRTSFVVAHRMSTLRRADLVVVIDNGRIVECGTHEQLMATQDGHYRVAAMLQSADHDSRRLLGLPPGHQEASAW